MPPRWPTALGWPAASLFANRQACVGLAGSARACGLPRPALALDYAQLGARAIAMILARVSGVSSGQIVISQAKAPLGLAPPSVNSCVFSGESVLSSKPLGGTWASSANDGDFSVLVSDL